MGMLDGKVAIITGSGRGLGKEEALAFAKEGCKILVNDLGTNEEGTKVADLVVEEIKKIGGEAVANYDSVTDFDKAKGMIDQAISELGRFDIVVNNAGIIRDRMIFNMTKSEWDAVIDVHLKGTFNLTHHAANYFRQEGKKNPVRKKHQRIINTASDSGLLGNVGQSNYGAAKAGIAAFTLIVAKELSKYATVNCVVPSARTRMTTDLTPNLKDFMQTTTKSGFDIFDPSHFAPLVVFLASEQAKDISGEVFKAIGDKVWVYRGWHTVNRIDNKGDSFTPQKIAERFDELMEDLPRKQTSADLAKEFDV